MSECCSASLLSSLMKSKDWAKTSSQQFQTIPYIIIRFANGIKMCWWCPSLLTHCGLVMPYGEIGLSTLAQVMACCLMALNYLNQCWLINEVPWPSSEGNFTKNNSAINYQNYLQNFLPKMIIDYSLKVDQTMTTVISTSAPQCSKS